VRPRAGREISTTAPYLLRNIEKGKKEKKSWYQYVFLEAAGQNDATDGREGLELDAPKSPR
jgi:hypothetical protein